MATPPATTGIAVPFPASFIEVLHTVLMVSLSDPGEVAREKGRQLFKMVADRWPDRRQARRKAAAPRS